MVDALLIAANQLDGIVLALKAHGNDINVDYLMGYYDKCANDARYAAIKGVEDET
jgi:hypothetical protein